MDTYFQGSCAQTPTFLLNAYGSWTTSWAQYGINTSNNELTLSKTGLARIWVFYRDNYLATNGLIVRVFVQLREFHSQKFLSLFLFEEAIWSFRAAPCKCFVLRRSGADLFRPFQYAVFALSSNTLPADSRRLGPLK